MRERKVPVSYSVNIPVIKFRTITEKVPVQRTKVEVDTVTKTVFETQVRTKCFPETKIVTKQIPVYDVISRRCPPCLPNDDLTYAGVPNFGNIIST